MSIIKIQRPLGVLTLTDTEINQMIDNKYLIDSIVLMLLKNDDTWENQFEHEFSKADANDFLKDYYLTQTNYSKDYITKLFDSLNKTI